MSLRCCALVPTYDNPRTVRGVVEALRAHELEVVLVDDGSAVEGREACQRLAEEGIVQLVRRQRNGGKGAAVKIGFAHAARLGFTHALQVDADAQHDLARVPAFLEAARAQPDALVLAYPEYEPGAPAARRWGRLVTRFWVSLEVGRHASVRDAMIGFRVYPLQAALALERTGDRMEFDVEVVVRLARAGTPIVNIPVGVRYLSAEEGGVSHFRMLRDNMRLSWMHMRLCTAGCLRWLVGPGGGAR